MGEFEQTLREIFGDSIDRAQTRLRELTKHAVRDEIERLEKEIGDLKVRVAALESKSVSS